MYVCLWVCACAYKNGMLFKNWIETLLCTALFIYIIPYVVEKMVLFTPEMYKILSDIVDLRTITC